MEQRLVTGDLSLQRSVFAAFCVALAGLAGAHAADRLPQTRAELIGNRTPLGEGADAGKEALGARVWGTPVQESKKIPAKSTALPAPPKLPFGYGGSGVVDGMPVLFLELPQRSRMVQVGDTVEDAYRVESIERNRALLRYLPLGVIQVMAFGQAGELDLVPAVAVATQGPLVVMVPDQAPLGQEVPVAVSIPPGSAATKAIVELTYDADALSVTGARILRPGRALVEMSAQDSTRSKQLRLRPIGQETVLTEIGIDATAVDAHGQSVPLSVSGQHFISFGDAN